MMNRYRQIRMFASAGLLLVSSYALAHVIPGLRRDLSDQEYQLAWAYMSINALNNCYEGPAREVLRAEFVAYGPVVRDIESEILKRAPRLDSHLLFLDVMRGAGHTFISERRPSGWICNYARITLARVYYNLFPNRCAASGGCGRLSKACSAVETGGVSKYDLCPDALIDDLARSGHLPVSPARP